MPHSHRIVRKFSFLLGAFGFREALRAVFLVTLARRSATAYGDLLLAFSMGSILLYVVECGFNQYLVPLLQEKERVLTVEVAKVTVLKGLVFLPACMVAIGFMHLQHYDRVLTSLILIILLGIGLDAIGSSFFVALQVKGRQASEAKIKTWAAALGFGYGVVAIWTGASPLAIACFKIIESSANLLGAVLGSPGGLRLRGVCPRLEELWKMARQGAVYTGMSVVTVIYNKANVFFLHSSAGAEGVALYGVTWDLVDGVASIAISLLLGNVLFPLFVDLWKNDAEALRRMAQETARWLLALALPVMFLLAIESDRIIPLLYGAGYQPAVALQKILSISLPISMLHNLAAYLMISMQRQRLLFAIYIGGLVFNLGLCAILIPSWPLFGAAAAILLTKGAVAIVTLSFCQKHLALFHARFVLPLSVAVFLGALLFYGGSPFLLRGFAELLAISPMIFLAWHWWRSKKGEV